MKAKVLIVSLLLSLTAMAQQVPTVEWDKHSLIIDGRRVMPVMGEVHYSRIPAEGSSRGGCCWKGSHGCGR